MTLVVSLAAVALVVAVGGWVRSVEAAPLHLEGVPLDAEDPAPMVRQLAGQWLDTELSLDAGSMLLRASRRELGASLEVEALVERARLARGRGPLTDRLLGLVSGERRELRFEPDVAEAEVLAFAEELRRRASVAAAPARLDGTGGRPGVTLNLMGTTAAIEEALRSGALYVRVPFRRLEPPTHPVRDVGEAIFTEIVAAHETRYRAGRDIAGRAANIELAARLLDNFSIAPGGQLSFNQIVGERTVERGFQPAVELDRGGHRVEGIGGGICQVAATLHAAAFFAGFDIVEHHPHTRTSSYIPAGLDSAISWPHRDLVIRNPYPFHVRVVASAWRGRLRIELVGAQRGPRVEWNVATISRSPRPVQRQVVPNLPVGTEEVIDEGEDGAVLERQRTIFWSDGRLTDTVRLRYPSVARVVRVGPGAPR